MANKVIVEVRSKLEHGQNLFRRSTVEKLIKEYERLLLRNTTLERLATQHQQQPDRYCPACHALLEPTSVYCDNCGTDTPRP